MTTAVWRTATLKRTSKSEHQPIQAAERIISELLVLRDTIKTIAEGVAILDFVQGYVATDLPATLARDIVDVLRDRQAVESAGPADDLVVLWLEHYRRAYSQMIMRVLEDGADSLTV